MAFKITNEDRRILRIYAEHLPIVMEASTEIHHVDADDIEDMGYVKKEGEEVKEGDVKAYHAPVQIARNHYRRLKDAWSRAGEKGVAEYFLEVVNIWKQNFRLEGEFKVKNLRNAGKIIVMYGPTSAVEVTFTDINNGKWQTTENITGKDDTKEAAVDRAKVQIREKVMEKMLELQYDAILRLVAESELPADKPKIAQA